MCSILICLHCRPWNDLLDHLGGTFDWHSDVLVAMDAGDRDVAFGSNSPQLTSEVGSGDQLNAAFDSNCICRENESQVPLHGLFRDSALAIYVE